MSNGLIVAFMLQNIPNYLHTEKQKQVLFDALAKEGLQWNAETKQIEKLRWRAKEYENYYCMASSGVFGSIETNSSLDRCRFDSGFYFQTQQQAEEAFKKVKELLLSL